MSTALLPNLTSDPDRVTFVPKLLRNKSFIVYISLHPQSAWKDFRADKHDTLKKRTYLIDFMFKLKIFISLGFRTETNIF